MGGIELRNGVLEVKRTPNELDKLAGEISSVLTRLDIEHAFVAWYVAILAGRSRSTEDIDVILEPLSESRAAALADELRDATLPIGPLELQIAYKLYLDTQKDFEDAAHLYVLLGKTLSGPELERWARELEVTEAYDRLQRA